MRENQPPRSHANGYALSVLLLLVLLASTYGAYRSVTFNSNESTRRSQILAKLAQARDALIAYAATDPNRPGQLLCPADLSDNGVSPLLTGDDCATYNGWLPWRTLDLAGDGDDRGQAIRYVVSPLFGGKRTSPPLNSETATSLSLDAAPGKTSLGIAALLIAPRGPLDQRNADGDDLFFNGQSGAPDDNDVIITVTREQLMAATEQRIANQLRLCLSEHIRSPQNLEQSYPWPAPPGKTLFQGNSGSLFGRFPETQAGNPEAALQSGVSRLNESKALIENTTANPAPIAALKELQQQATILRPRFDRLYETAIQVDSQARTAHAMLTSLDNQLANNASGMAGPSSLEATRESLGQFIATLEDSGFDCFEQELATLNGALQASIDKARATTNSTTLGKVLANINTLKAPLLSSATTPNPDLQNQVDANQVIAADAAQAVSQAKSKLGQATAALDSATTLFDANARLGADIRSRRVNLDAGELRYRARRITELASAIATNSFPASNDDLARTLAATRTLLQPATSASGPVQQAFSAVDAAWSAAQSNDTSPLAAAASEAGTRLSQLAAWLDSTGDNLAIETLKTVDAALVAASRSPTLSAGQSSALRPALAMATYWSLTASAQAADIARLARKSITAKEDSDTSAYSAARRLFNSLVGDSGSISLLEKLNSTTSASTQDAAERALATSLTRLSELITASQRLDANLSSGHAKAALPVTWFGNACDFMQASNAAPSWWSTHGWRKLFFYQITDRIRPDSGALTVNGQGRYPFIVIGAGQPLPGRQNRSANGIAQFLESRNAHPSRDGLALSPSRDFSKATLARDFNDQLAY